ncbi:restriction endonuclease [Natrinema sp. LN54]|uniref:restriction endonuclease n=1 Tax=Natrinema sp. LN54 TaxID=3458705 RepID=UPI004035A581
MDADRRAEALLDGLEGEEEERTRATLEELDRLADEVDDPDLEKRLTKEIYAWLHDEPALFVADPETFFDELLATEGFDDGMLETFSAVAEEPPAAFEAHVDELLALLADGSELKRGLALRTLYHLAARRPRAVAGATHAFRASLDDLNPRIRGTACLALGYLTAGDAQSALEDRLHDESQYVREAAAWALDRLEGESTGADPADSWTAAAFEDVSPTAFEALVADLWDAMGYRTEVTPASRDGGIDVIATTDDERVAIQAKRFLSSPVGSPDTRQIAGQLQLDFDRAALVTTASFTGPAERFAAEATAVELVDGVSLRELLELHDIDPRSYR